ncbi:MAG: response regulator [Thiohalophilus sp.]|jgi:class 3 adenylate cyclase
METEKNKKILIIDDVSSIRALFARFLKMDGYETVEAGTGEDALKLAQETRFDGILLDLNMPGIDGLETCRKLRALKGYKITPILVVTSSDKTSILSDAFEAGCDDFITKPINHVVLCARLKGHIQRAEFHYQNEHMREQLNRYVSPKTQHMIEQYAGELPHPEKREVCVMFTDIRGFTQLAHQIDPEELFNLISEHLGRQAELVYQYDGYVDNFSGDGITAVFEGDDMETRSCLCAQEVIAHAQEQIIKKQNHLFAVSCGLSKGMAVIGNIGSSKHLNYTLVGETVNLAARLSGCGGPISIIVNENIHDAVKQDSRFLFLPMEEIVIKGFERPLNIYELTPSIH